MKTYDADAIVVGGGLAGLAATAELADAGKRVILLDQEPEASLGGQAFWSFGGLFFVDSPEQRRLGIGDSRDLAWQDWLGSAGFDRPEDQWPKRWAEAYVHFAAGEKRAWLYERGLRWFPVVGWAARGGYGACRIAEAALAQLNGASRVKTYLGYSDNGAVIKSAVALKAFLGG